MTDRVDAVVIGAGVVGLACARRLALAGYETIVLESAEAIGTGSSARNSEVIHAGMYYAPGGLKAKACVTGRKLLYDYCASHGVDHRRIGKLIVATREAEIAELGAIAARARENGLDGADALVELSGAEARRMEPEVDCLAALFSPSTGIVDSHGLMLALQGDLEAAGGAVALNAEVRGVRSDSDGHEIAVLSKDGAETLLRCRLLVNAAGHGAAEVARNMAGLDPALVPRTYYLRGCYFTLTGRAPFTHLVYPAPDAATLGLHLTIDLGGQAKFGPDQEWIDGLDYTVDPKRADSFYESIRRYYPGLADGALQPGYAGIRPKIQGPGEPPRDFLIQGPSAHGRDGLVNLFGIESPGLTSCLALGDIVAETLGL